MTTITDIPATRAASLQMTGRQLVELHNALADQLGGSIPEVTRFPAREAGIRRVHRMLDTLEARIAATAPLLAPVAEPDPAEDRLGEMTVQAGAAAAAAHDAREALGTIRAITEAYNALVPEATALGVRAKHHTSMFETKAKGMVQLEKLRAAIAAARTAQ